MNSLRVTRSMRRRALVIASLMAMTALAWMSAFALVFDLRVPDAAVRVCLTTLPWLVVVRLALSHRFRLDRSSWQHVGLPDLIHLVLAATIGSLVYPLVLLAVGRLGGIPLSVFVVDWLLVTALTCGSRVAVRWLHERRQPTSRAGGAGRRTIIVGAGEGGEQLLRQILHDQRQQYRVVALVDDDPAKLGMSLHGVPVVGSSEEMRRHVAIHQVNLALIAIPSAEPPQIKRLVSRCVDAGVEVKLLPPMQDLMTADIKVQHVRDVQIEDLLGREPVTLDLEPVAPEIAGKVVMVTGSGGSIGSELARQIARFSPRRLILFERAESPLYFINLEVARDNPAVDVIPVLASVTNQDRLEQVFETYRPDVVFHAAAYKHVPMLEANAVEGVWNNVMGTLRLARCAARSGTRKFVFISTDKAVNPSSILGTTKRIAERIVLELPSLRGSTTDFRVVRFGNVLGSDGSVVPLFKKQLAMGGPITVTHPEVKRYFMTIPEAVQLVLQSIALPEAAGRIALLEMGTQVRIVDLAEQLIRLNGLTPGEDIKIVFTGLRPGEKIEEELLAPGEVALPTAIDKIRVVERDGADGTALAQKVRSLIQLMARRDEPALKRALATLIPEYQLVVRDFPENGNGKHAAGSNGNGNGSGARARRRTLSIREARPSQLPLPVPPTTRKTGTERRP